MYRYLLLTTLLSLHALAGKFEGVEKPDTIEVGGKTLQLNGQGLRMKFIVKVYVGSLYLESKSSDGTAILGKDQVRRVEMTMLRDLTRDQLADAIRDGVKANYSNFDAVKDRVEALLAKFSQVKKGEDVVVTYVPGEGTTVTGGTLKHVTPGRDFADALFSAWLGKNPADKNLQKGMLGLK